MSLVPYKLNPEEEKKILEELLKETPDNYHDGGTGTTVFSIASTSQYFRITGVLLGNNVVSCDVDKKYNLNLVHTQGEWGGLRDKVVPKGEFYAGTASEYYAIWKALHKNKDNTQFKAEIEEARAYLQDVLKQQNPYMMSLSRAKFNPAGLDEIVHGFGMKKPISKPAKLKGQNGCITDKKVNAQEYAQAVFDTTDTVEQINEALKWVTGKETYAWRINQTQNQQERVVALGVIFSDWFILAAGDLIVSRPALGVRFARKNFMENKGELK